MSSGESPSIPSRWRCGKANGADTVVIKGVIIRSHLRPGKPRPSNGTARGPSAVVQVVEQALKNVGRRGLVDQRGAAAAREVALDHAALDRGGRQPLVPE